jgi:hypothetical protein
MRSGRLMALVTALIWLTSGALLAQEAVTGSSVSLSSGAASLELELAGGGSSTISFEDGDVFIDGDVVGSYDSGGALERSWRALLGDPELFGASDVAGRLAAWDPDAGGAAEATAAGALEELFDRLVQGSDQTTAGALPETATVARPGGGQVSIAPGILSLDALTRSVDVLRRSLDRLGGQAQGVEDNLALVVHDDYSIGVDRVVDGNLALLSGDLILEGTVKGDVLVLDGTLTLEPSARVEGNVLNVGGEVNSDGGRVSGEIVSLIADHLADVIAADITDVDADVPVRVRVGRGSHGRGFIGGIGHNIGRAVGGVMAVLAWLLALGALGVAVVYFFRQRLERAADAVRADVPRAFGVGLAGQLLVLPVLLLLVVGIVTWLVIPVYALAVALAIPAGYLAVAHAVGEMAVERRFDWMERLRLGRNNSYYYVLNGLGLLLAPFAAVAVLYLLGGMFGFVRGLMSFAAGVMTWAAVTAGFGAIILTRGGGRTARRHAADFDDLFASDEPAAQPTEGEASA